MPRYHFVVCEPDHTHDDPMVCIYQIMTPQKIMGTGKPSTRSRFEKFAHTNPAPLMSALGQKRTFNQRLTDVRFTPESRHSVQYFGCPLCAKSGHYAVQQNVGYPITSSAVTSKVRKSLGMIRERANCLEHGRPAPPAGPDRAIWCVAGLPQPPKPACTGCFNSLLHS